MFLQVLSAAVSSLSGRAQRPGAVSCAKQTSGA